MEIRSTRGPFIGVMCSIKAMINATHSQQIQTYMIYLSEKGHYRGKYMQPSNTIEFHVRIQVKDQIHATAIYLRAAFMTIFAVHPDAIIQGQLLCRLWLLIGKLTVKHPHTSDTRYTCIRIMPKTVSYHCQYTGLMTSHLLLLPWCMAITGYLISCDNNNSQKQPTAGYRQTSKLLPGTSLPKRLETTTKQYTHDNSSMLTLYSLFYAQAVI